jgi:hypothetical protein
VPKDEFHFRLILILLQVFVRILVGGSLFIAGAVLGVILLQMYSFLFWVPPPLLFLTIVTKRFYSTVFLLGVLLPLLGGIH